MPNLKKNPSAEKKVRSDARKTLYRGRVRNSTRTQIKKVRTLIAAGQIAEAEEAIIPALQSLDKAAQKGVFHKNNASRRKARLVAALNKARTAS